MQREKKNNPAKMLQTAKLTFRGIYRDVLYFIPDNAATERG